MTPGEPKGRGISQFMWGYQHIFRFSAELSLREALADIRAEVAADFFLVGFREEPTPDSWPICIEPERGPYHPRHLVGVPSRAAELYEEDPERRIFHSNRDLH